ncbi:MAG: cytochrome c oxidase assembly factor 1 family protein [Phycisphaeraceae bacterium]|nr:cytochrome c oxidase assembly factor 1 family protein [Phycisphaeraceae bacterium]
MSASEHPPTEKLPLLPKRKKFLIPIIILLCLTLIGSVAGLFIGFASIKSSDAFKLTMAELEASDAVKQHVGLPLDPGTIVIGKHDDRNGTYDLTFAISGPNGSAAVRSRCESEAEGDPWQITFLDIGVGGREGTVITLIGDPKNPPGSN